MKCRSPFMWFARCLKNTWRYFFRKRAPPENTNQQFTAPAGLTGITVQTSSDTQIAGQVPWMPETLDSPVRLSFPNSNESPRVLPQVSELQSTPSGSQSAVEAWRNSIIKQKTAPPVVAEQEPEPNFFDTMEPSLRKPKVVSLRSSNVEGLPDVGSRLVFNANAAPANTELTDWAEEDNSGAGWEAAIDDLDPRAVKKAKRKAARDQQSTSLSNAHPPGDNSRSRKQMV